MPAFLAHTRLERRRRGPPVFRLRNHITIFSGLQGLFPLFYKSGQLFRPEKVSDTVLLPHHTQKPPLLVIDGALRLSLFLQHRRYQLRPVKVIEVVKGIRPVGGRVPLAVHGIGGQRCDIPGARTVQTGHQALKGPGALGAAMDVLMDNNRSGLTDM